MDNTLPFGLYLHIMGWFSTPSNFDTWLAGHENVEVFPRTRLGGVPLPEVQGYACHGNSHRSAASRQQDDGLREAVAEIVCTSITLLQIGLFKLSLLNIGPTELVCVLLHVGNLFFNP